MRVSALERLHPDEHGASDLVVKAALIRIPYQNGNDEQPKRCTHDRTPDSDPPADKRDEAQTKDPMADGGSQRRDEHDLEQREVEQVPESQVTNMRDQVRRGSGKRPVKKNRANATPDPRH